MNAPWLTFTQPAVRDLAWLIGTPPLLTPAPHARHFREVLWPSSDYFHQLLVDTMPLLQQIDADPCALISHTEASRDFRLGVYVERLLGFWLAHPENPRYTLVAANVPVRDQGITLGEMDYVVRNKHDGSLAHWELAVKFYLGRPEANTDQQWLGPGLHDRLDIKRDHLCDHQLRLSLNPLAREAIAPHLSASERAALHRDGLARVCWLKGRLFDASDARWAVADPVHGNPQALRGQWRIAPEQLSNSYRAIAAGHPDQQDYPRLRGERLYQTQWSVSADWPNTAFSPRR